MDIRHLRTFIALCEEGSFTGAATRLRISQPVVSRTIRQLERYVGRELVDRSASSVRPTALGRMVLAHARTAVAEFERTLNIGRTAHLPLRLGYVWSAMDERILSVVKAWERKHPDVPIMPRKAGDRLAGLADGHADVGLVRERPPEPAYASRLILREKRYAALSTEHPLASREVLRLEDLGTETLVINTSSGTVPPTTWPGEWQPPRTLLVETFEDWVFSVAVNKGVGLTPASTADTSPHPTVTYVPVVDAPEVSLHLAWRSPGSHPALTDFIRYTINAFRDR
ncbi:LysR family transcriptional regulator [Streptomyces alkaliphilus]|uniref:LysR family transcriptional regulator n=1 Tax=Streptomyces alkaliphilus TaxID=1472722 RepID=UPI00117DEA21|nr:LysR substrate-binding domain-containing protein [Streptomyces alkaliphilus]MQS06022.1 LysR family transcriptional regulator [Streptomyces alkaliphilus]